MRSEKNSLADLKQIEKDWVARGFSFGVWKDPPGQVWENFRHEADELFMVVSGRVELEMGGKHLFPSPGEEVLIPAKTYHSVYTSSDRPSKWLYGYRLK